VGAVALMARLTNPAVVELDTEMLLALLIGPASEDAFTDEELEAAWRYHRDELTGRAVYPLPGCRPWWAFEAGRPEHLEEYPAGHEQLGANQTLFPAPIRVVTVDPASRKNRKDVLQQAEARGGLDAVHSSFETRCGQSQRRLIL
jgi:hypothetical protein